MESNPYPKWWRDHPMPPPPEWTYVMEEFTGADTGDEWAVAAALFIAKMRHRNHQGPTFGELFTHLLPDTDGLPGPFPDGMDKSQRRRAMNAFRLHAALHWNGLVMIRWEKDVPRSLQVGRAFRYRFPWLWRSSS